MVQYSCPKCGSLAPAGKFAAWKIIVAILLFPLGLLILLTGRKPRVCPSCKYHW